MFDQFTQILIESGHLDCKIIKLISLTLIQEKEYGQAYMAPFIFN